ncbi:MAG: hypothetical protein ABUS49_01990 [Acidobacteriota bacterium]
MHLLSLFQGPGRHGAAPRGRLGRARKGRGQSDLQLPLLFHGSVAVLESGYRLDRQTREFTTQDSSGLQEFDPRALIAPLHAAMELAHLRLRGLLTLPSLELALVLTRIDGTPLAAGERDLLWRAFAIPVFEQLRDAGGRVIARECEVHDGLHLDAAAVIPAELKGEIVNEHCECGGETPRLKRQVPGREKAAAAVAATA